MKKHFLEAKRKKWIKDYQWQEYVKISSSFCHRYLENFIKRTGGQIMISLSELLEKTTEQNASDLHLTVGSVPVIRVNGHLIQVGKDKLTPADTEKYSREILQEFL